MWLHFIFLGEDTDYHEFAFMFLFGTSSYKKYYAGGDALDPAREGGIRGDTLAAFFPTGAWWRQ